jgi:RNA polymerase sigma-70 factor (ECF subfamily)
MTETPSTAGFDGQLDAAIQRAYVAAWRLLRDREAARDACQEAAARALAARHRYDPTQPFYPWFYRILKNHCLDVLRRRETAMSARPEVKRQTRQRRVDTTAEAEAAYAQSERERAVLTAVSRLPDDLRELIELRHFQDLSYREMAEVLGCPIGTVMSRLYRARKALRDVLLSEPDLSAALPRRTEDSR